MAAHEADMRAGDTSIKREMLDERDVETRGIEAAARHRDEMGDSFRRDSGVRQSVLCRGESQRVCLFFVAPHAIVRRWVLLGVKRLAGVKIAFGGIEHHAVPRIHTRPAVDALEEPALYFVFAGVLLGDFGSVFLANPMGGHRGSDPGDQDGHVQLAVE